MATFDRQTYYYSGQGVVMIGERDADGKPRGLKAVGNVTDLKVAIETSVLEHKESQSGQRAVDFRLTTETKASLSMTFENFVRDILALALRGDYTDVAAGSVTGGAIKWHPGVMPLPKIKVSAVAVKRGATALTAYVDAVTPWDYKLNAEAGSIQFNDGATLAVDKITTGGTVPTVITVGTLTRVTVANTAAVGDYAIITGLAGADAAMINGKALKVAAATSTYVDLALDTTGKTITIGTPLSVFSGQALAVDYTYAAQGEVNALTRGAQERYLRFEGLNTLDGNNPVVVEVFKFTVDPAKEQALISGEEAAGFVLEGSVLADPLQTSGSQFFKERMLR